MFGLNWLQRKDRHLPKPLLIIVDEDDVDGAVSGCYIQPENTKEPCNHYGIDFPTSKHGIILAVEYEDYYDIAATLAHEWRHHYQKHHGLLSKDSPSLIEEDISYENHIVKYFGTCWHEFDALRFEVNTVNNPESIWRYSATVEYLKTGKVLPWGG